MFVCLFVLAGERNHHAIARKAAAAHVVYAHARLGSGGAPVPYVGFGDSVHCFFNFIYAEQRLALFWVRCVS